MTEAPVGWFNAWSLFSRNARLYLVASTLAGYCYSGLFFLLANLFYARLGFDEKQIGIFVAVGAASFALSSMPAGLAGRRWGTRRAMVGGFALLAIGLAMVPLALLLAPGWRTVWIIAACVVREFGNSNFMVNTNPYLMAVTSSRERSHLFAARAALVPLAGFLGSLSGGALPALSRQWLERSPDDPVGFMAPMMLSGVALLPGLVALVATATQSRQPVEAAVSGSSASPRLPQDPAPPTFRRPGPAAVMISLVGLLYIAAMAASMSFITLYLDGELNVPTVHIGWVLAAGQLGAVPAALALAPLVRRVGYRGAFTLAASGVALSTLPLGLEPHWIAAAIGAGGITVLSSIAFPAITVYSQELVAEQFRPMMSGAYMMSVAAGWTLVASTGGYLITWLGYRGLFLLGGGITTVGVLLFVSYAWGLLPAPAASRVGD